MVANKLGKSSLGKNAGYIQESNRSLVMQILAQSDICTRVILSEKTGLRQATITNIISDLIDFGFVNEIGMVNGKLGRRSIGIKLNTESFKVIGIKLTREDFTLGVFDLKGNSINQFSERLIIEKGPFYAIEHIGRRIHDILEENSDIYAVGMAVPGPFLRHESKVVLMSEFPGWGDVNIKYELSKYFSIPLFIEHDANAGVMAEWKFGKYRRTKGVIAHFLASTGIGLGVVQDGQIFTGSNGVACEIGHVSINYNGERCVCGNYGCLELYCSAISMVKRTAKKLPQFPLSSLNKVSHFNAHDIFKFAQDGDTLCTKMVQEMGFFIGCGIANVINSYNPDVIVISDIMTEGGEIMLEVIRQTVKNRVLPCLYENLTIDYSNLNVDSILLGAASVAIDKLLCHPQLFNEANKL